MSRIVIALSAGVRCGAKGVVVGLSRVQAEEAMPCIIRVGSGLPASIIILEIVCFLKKQNSKSCLAVLGRRLWELVLVKQAEVPA